MNFSELSDCEILTMRCIWSAHEDLSVAEIREKVREQFGKKYERSTICTFVRRLETKGYLSVYSVPNRRGYLYRPLIDEQEFRELQQKKFVNFWFGGSLPQLLTAFCKKEEFTHEEIKELRAIIDELDEED